MTLTSAPVSTRKRKLEFQSRRKNRRLLERPVALVATNDWPVCFPTLHKVDGTAQMTMDSMIVELWTRWRSCDSEMR